MTAISVKGQDFFSLFWFYVSSENFTFDEIKGKNDENLEFFKLNFSQSKEEPYSFSNSV